VRSFWSGAPPFGDDRKVVDEVVNVPGKKAWRFHFLLRGSRRNIRLIPIRYNHTDALLEASSRSPRPQNSIATLRGRKSHIVVVALATLVGCAPLAEVRETNPRLSAQYGTLPQLQRAEQEIASGQEVKRTDPDRAIGSSIHFRVSRMHDSQRRFVGR
jgi:hypothetical protein